MQRKPDYSIVVPVYNSVSTLSGLVKQIIESMNSVTDRFEIILVDDCSSDESWKTIESLSNEHKVVRGVLLGRNSGQFAATFCGAEEASGNIVITIDDDMQHSPTEIPKLISHFQESGQLLVYGVPQKKKYNLKTKVYAIIMQTLVYLTVFRFYMLKGFYYTGFRIFNKKNLWNDSLRGIAQHFDIYAMWHLDPKYIGFIHVKYQQRQKGKSGQTFRKKSSDAILNAMCTFRSPLDYMFRIFQLCLLLSITCFLYVFFPLEIKIPSKILTGVLLLFLSILSLNLYIIGLYLGRIYTLKRGCRDYFIVKRTY